jgi:hypothetical protein
MKTLKNKTRWMGAAFVALCVPLAWAAEFEVGRAKVELAGEGWRAIDMADGGKPYNGGVRDSIPAETKVFVKEGANKQVQTVVVIRSSTAGRVNGGLVYSHTCKGNEEMYAEGNAGAHTNNYDCTRVWPLYRVDKWVDDFVPTLRDKLTQTQLTLPNAVQPVISHFANSNGSFAEARVFVSAGFAGSDGAAPSEIPKDIKPAAVLWAQSLAKAVRGSVGSFSGRLTVPPIQYNNADTKTVSN